MNDKTLTTCSATFQQLLNTSRMVAASDAPILITGESGSGRATLARDIHQHSRFRHQPMQLLGHGESPPQADFSGTLFVADIQQLGAEEQLRLREWFDQNSGNGQLRLIASASPDISERVDGGEFSADLYFRLAVVPLQVPPLRERRDDLVPLLKRISVAFAREGRVAAPVYPLATRNRLKSYAWPGNLRELHNFCQRMVLLHPGQKVLPEMLPGEMQPQTERQEPLFVLPTGGVDLTLLEADVIRQALDMANGNRSRAARLLGISRDTLLYRLRKHALV
jgi:DNA-binding NtrC family response regulator